MSFDIKFVPPQSDRIAIVTGANTGLGYETALGLCKTGMKVVLACRDLKKARIAKSELQRQSINADIDIIGLDLSSLASVRAFSSNYLSRYDRLDLLINNAGIMIPPYSLTEDGFESQLGVNHLGHFLLTGLLLPALEQTEGSRIVILSSLAHKTGKINFKDLQSKKRYQAWTAYAQSKLACLMFALELQRRLQAHEHQTISVAAHPGVASTELSRHLPSLFNAVISPIFLKFAAQTAQQGAMPALYAALNPNIKGGEYIGPLSRNGWKGKAGVVTPKKHAHDEEVARRLWQESERLTDIQFLD